MVRSCDFCGLFYSKTACTQSCIYPVESFTQVSCQNELAHRDGVAKLEMTILGSEIQVLQSASLIISEEAFKQCTLERSVPVFFFYRLILLM